MALCQSGKTSSKWKWFNLGHFRIIQVVKDLDMTFGDQVAKTLDMTFEAQMAKTLDITFGDQAV